nr:DUF6265 family protein [Polymorphobacter sp.]
MLRSTFCLVCLTLLTAATPVPPTALDWLAGQWVEDKGDRWTEESWLPARGGLLIGVNRSGRGTGPADFEYMRIAAGADGVLRYFGGPAGAVPVAFRLTAADGRSVLFENPAHDFPTIVRYRRDGERLHAEVSGPGGANAQRWTFERR